MCRYYLGACAALLLIGSPLSAAAQGNPLGAANPLAGAAAGDPYVGSFSDGRLTLDAARILGVDDRLGSLEAGKLADVIVVGGNPLDDLDALERVQMVYKEGSRLV